MKARWTFCAVMLALLLAHGCSGTTNAEAAAQATPQATVQATSPTSKSKATVVSAANFVSLEWKRTGGFASHPMQMLVRRGSARLHRGSPGDKSPARKKALSQAELGSLLKLLNEAPFSQAVGRSKASVAPDAISDQVTLVLQEKNARPTSLVADYHQSDPKPTPTAFDKIIKGLYALRNKKFPNAERQ